MSVRSTACLLAFSLFVLALAGCGGGGGNSSPKVSAAKSTITAAPTTVTANGKAVANITVSLKDANGNAYTGSADVAVKADPCSNCTLYYENHNGQVTGTIKSTAAEDITLSFTVNDELSPSTVTIHFVAGPPDAEQSKISVVNPDVAAWADGYSSKQVVVTLYDRFGNRITSGDYRNDINFFQVPPPSSVEMALGASVTSHPQPQAFWDPFLDLADCIIYIVKGNIPPCSEVSSTQALGAGQYGASVTTIGGARSEAVYADYPGALSTNRDYLSALVGFYVLGVRSPNTVEFTFDSFFGPFAFWCWSRHCDDSHAVPAANASSAVTAPASLTIMQAWTVETCSQAGVCSDHGLYEASTTDPSVPATLAVPGDLMVPAAGHPAIVVELVDFDAKAGVLYEMGPGAVIYAQDGKLWRLDMTHGVSAPERLSTLTLTALCSLTPISPYNVVFGDTQSVGAPTGLIVAGFDAKGKTAADCASKPAKRWLVFSDGGANPPIALNADQHYLMSLADPKSGAALGLLFQDGTDLVLYSPNFSQSMVLAKGLVPAGSRALAMNYRGMHTYAVVDIAGASGATRTDRFYRVGLFEGALPTTQLATLSVPTSNPYFSQCTNGAADFLPGGVVGTDGTVYFPYPTATGFSIEALAPASGALTAIYNESASHCDEPGVWATTSGYYSFTESNVGTGATRFISVAENGAPDQTPVILASVDKSGSLTVPYYSVGTDTLWIAKGECSDAACSQRNVSVTAIEPDNTFPKVFADTILAGDVQQGMMAASGNIQRVAVALAQGPAATCNGTAWALYEPATLQPAYTPNFGAGACANRAFLYGPHVGLLTGNVPDASGGGTSAFSLYNPFGAQYVPPVSPVLKKLGHYSLPSGAASIEVVPIF